MQNSLAFILIILQIFNYSNIQNNTSLYLDPIKHEFNQVSFKSDNDIDNFLSFVKNNSLHNINPKILKDNIINGIVKSLDDKYSSIEDKSSKDVVDELNASYAGFGFDLEITGSLRTGKFVITNILENSAADDAGLKVGDIILSINEIKIYASNKLYQGALELPLEDGNHKFLINRNKENKTFYLKTKKYKEPPISTKTINKDVYYIKINNCSQDMPLYMKSELKKLEKFKFSKLIIDLRHNFGGWESSVIEVAAMMCGDEIICYHKDKNGISEINRGDVKQITKIKPIVLISKNTASSAELLASLLREHSKATLIGSTTYGKNQSQGIYEFNGKIFKFSNAYIAANNKFDLKFLGVKPDIEVEDYYSSPYVDLVLKKALDLLD